MFWRVKVHLEGVIRVDAESAVHAEEIVQERAPELNGQPVYDRRLYVETLGPVENHSIDPHEIVIDLMAEEHGG